MLCAQLSVSRNFTALPSVTARRAADVPPGQAGTTDAVSAYTLSSKGAAAPNALVYH